MRSTQINSLIRTLTVVGLLAALMAAVIAWRVSHRPGAPALPPILGWQLVVWLPWIGYYYAVRHLVRRFGTYQDATTAGLAWHLLGAVLVATTHLVWFWQTSSLMSPFLGLPGTRYGVYAFFFIFWFFIDLLLYWVVFTRPDATDKTAGQTTTERFAVRKGRSRHLVRAADIRWVEAQGYYAALHTENGCFLLRRSLTRLEEELDPARFVRVHRSTIVNVGEVRSLKTSDKGACMVVLADGAERSVSRAGRRRLKSALQTV